MRQRKWQSSLSILGLLMVAALAFVLWPEAQDLPADPPWLQLHEYRLGARISDVTPGLDGELFAGDDDGNTYCFNREGALLWQTELDPKPEYMQLEPGPRGELIVRSFNLTYCIEADGRQHWYFNSERPREKAPISSVDPAEYIVEAGRKLIAIRRNGTVAWETQPEAEPLQFWGDLTVTNFPQAGRCYFSDGQQAIWSIKADGTDMRRLGQATGYIGSITARADGSCLLLAATPDRHDADERLYCSGQDGELSWAYDGYYSLGPPVLLEDGSLLLSAADYFDQGRLGVIKLDAAGKLMWSHFEQANSMEDWVCPLQSGSSWLLFSVYERRGNGAASKGLANLRQRIRLFAKLDTSREEWVDVTLCITFDAQGNVAHSWKGHDVESHPQFSMPSGQVQIGVADDRVVWFGQR